MKSTDLLFCHTSFFTLILAAASESGATLSAAARLEKAETLRSLAENELRAAERSATALRGPRVARLAGRFAVAWADEYLMTRDWAGRRCWTAHPLQGDWAEGRNAGDGFFQDLQALVPSSDDDVAVAGIALRCLSLGFAGRFHGQPETLAKLHEDTVRRFSLKTRAPAFPIPLEHIPSRMKTCWYAAWLLLFGVVGFWLLQEHALHERGQNLLKSAITEQRAKSKKVSFEPCLNIPPGGRL